jgi:hypothetical protein
MKELMNQQEGLEEQTCGESSYYYQLHHYTPLWYSGRGVPMFLINRDWYTSFPCLICINVVFALAMAASLALGHSTNKAEFQMLMLKLYLVCLSLIDFSYFLTVAMNPGIVSEEHMGRGEGEVRYCKVCDRRKVEMTHCNECQVCVQDIDHHCGFFGKCIAGKQRFAFYSFLLFMFMGFIVFFVGLSSYLG